MNNSDLERQSELQVLYLRNMQKIKWRITAIKDVFSKKRTTTYQHTNIEFCMLQIRKILELIALSSLISDADVYRAQLSNVEKMWNARLILRDLERINPDFYPKAIIIDPNDKDNWLDKEEPYLTKEDFVRIYEKCGHFLHEDSPFKTETDIQHDYESIWKEMPIWVGLIISLLNTHLIHLFNHKDLFYTSMGAEGEQPKGNIFTRIEL